MVINLNYEVYKKVGSEYIYDHNIIQTSIYKAVKSLVSDKTAYIVKDVDWQRAADNRECVYITLEDRENKSRIINYMIRQEWSFIG